MTKEEVLRELEEWAQDPHQDQLLEKFVTCPESRRLSEQLGAALGLRLGCSPSEHGPSLPVPAGLVHPG
jgi:hypothetical protein